MTMSPMPGLRPKRLSSPAPKGAAAIDMDGDRRLISVDVETTSTSPERGELATAGFVAYDERALTRLDALYVRLRPKRRWAPKRWWAQNPLDAWTWTDATRTWWETQAPAVTMETFAPGAGRMSPADAGRVIWEWLVSLGGPITFAADPACFDFGWVWSVLWDHLGVSPTDRGVDYHCIDLRSMAYALGRSDLWLGKQRPDWELPRIEPVTAHSAISDAEAQGARMAALVRLARSRVAERAGGVS